MGNTISRKELNTYKIMNKKKQLWKLIILMASTGRCHELFFITKM